MYPGTLPSLAKMMTEKNNSFAGLGNDLELTKVHRAGNEKYEGTATAFDALRKWVATGAKTTSGRLP
jgi:hypothetical protein